MPMANVPNLLTDTNTDNLVKSRHSREGGNPCVLTFLKRMDSRLRTSGMTANEHFLVNDKQNAEAELREILLIERSRQWQSK
jgi:hypothetical protein